MSGPSRIGPSPHGGRTLARTLSRRTSGGQEDDSQEEAGPENDREEAGQEDDGQEAGQKDRQEDDGQEAGSKNDRQEDDGQEEVIRRAASPPRMRFFMYLPDYHDEKETPGTADRAFLFSCLSPPSPFRLNKAALRRSRSRVSVVPIRIVDRLAAGGTRAKTTGIQAVVPTAAKHDHEIRPIIGTTAIPRARPPERGFTGAEPVPY